MSKANESNLDVPEYKNELFKEDKIVAILSADLHFSPKPPIARSVEESWYEVMGRSLSQVRGLCRKYSCPWIVAGDWFDRWNSSSEIVNFVLANLPEKVYGICGQHDLRNHSYEDIKKTSYWTLVESGKVVDLVPGQYIEFHKGMGNAWFAVGFPWGSELKPLNIRSDCRFLAVVHKYIWIKGHSFPHAPRENRLKSLRPLLKGYTASVFGDNHSGFCYGIKGVKPFIFNAGTFLRRKIDEVKYQPQVGLLYNSGLIVPYSLDCSEDKFLKVEGLEELAESAMEIGDIVKMLTQGQIGKKFIDFGDAIKEFCTKNKVSERVQSLLSEMLE